MKRGSLFVIFAFLAGLAIGFFARDTLERRAHRADLLAIDKLHKADVACTLTQDPNCLTALWSDDGINLGFAGPPVVGIKAMGDAYAKFRVEHPDFRVLNYKPDIKDVELADGWAIEVGDFAGTYEMSAKENPVSVKGEGMRVLKRQSDGSWKFALVGLK